MSRPDIIKLTETPLAFLRRLMCLLACRPGNDPDEQIALALNCLVETLAAEAAGVYWIKNGKLVPQAQSPAHFSLDSPLKEWFSKPDRLTELLEGQDGITWLAVPMRAGGVPLGRLWLVMPAGHVFSDDERELVRLAGNQLATAQENLRLYREVAYLAERRGALLRRIINMQDQRCRHVSRELHDEISPTLAALLIDVETIQARQPAAAEALQPYLDRFKVGLEGALDEINRIVLDLRPALLEDHGLVAALNWFGSERLRPAGATFHVDACCPLRLPDHLETTLYRIAQEAITNVARHSGAANAWLEVSCPDHSFVLAVRDDGCGFNVQRMLTQPEGLQGVGLFGMKERAALVGCELSIESTAGQGTRVQVVVPLAEIKRHGQD